MKIKSEREWITFTKVKKFPNDIPKNAWQYYNKRNQWKEWPDFLGRKK